jgi:hypothetical protein
MRTIIVFTTLALVFGCAEKRTKYSDKVMTVMIDPDSIRPDDYVRLQDALVESGKWTVLDRHSAFAAIKKEQGREHKQDQDQFDNARKWAMWGKMYGVGGVVVANAQCQTQTTIFLHEEYLHCLQSLSIVDASTTEVITHISYVQDGDTNQTYIAPPWDDAVEKLNKAFPSKFEEPKYTQRLLDYMKSSEQAGIKDSGAVQPARRPAAVDTTVDKQ